MGYLTITINCDIAIVGKCTYHGKNVAVAASDLRITSSYKLFFNMFIFYCNLIGVIITYFMNIILYKYTFCTFM